MQLRSIPRTIVSLAIALTGLFFTGCAKDTLSQVSYTVEEFVQNVQKNDTNILRTSDSSLTTIDQVFMNKMNDYIAEADDQYQKMFFKNINPQKI